MNIHKLKSWPESFAQIKSGEKSFELRWNDRDYAVGDELRLREWYPEQEIYTGAEQRVIVTSMMTAEDVHHKLIVRQETPWPIAIGWVILSIRHL